MGTEKDDSSPRIVTISQQGHLCMYTVTRIQSGQDAVSRLAVTCDIQCHYKTLKHILQDAGIGNFES